MLFHSIIHVLITALAVLFAARIIPGIRVKSFGSAVVFAVVLAVITVVLKWALVFISFPLIALTLGLFLLVINGFLFWLADKVVDGVEVDGFGSAVLGSMVTTAITWAATLLLGF
jgi:putative membrane protein